MPVESIEFNELLELYGLGVFAVSFDCECLLLLKSELLLSESRAAAVRWNFSMLSALKLSYDSDLWHKRISDRPTAPMVDSQLNT